MKRATLVHLILVVSAFADATMHNADVVRLVRHGASVTEIVGKINTSASRFTLFTEDIAALREDGVPDIVIRAMLARQVGNRLELNSAPTAQVPFTSSSSPHHVSAQAQQSRPEGDPSSTTTQPIPTAVLRPGPAEVSGGPSVTLPRVPNQTKFGSEYDAKLGTVETTVGGGIMVWDKDFIKAIVSIAPSVNLHRLVSVYGEWNYSPLGSDSVNASGYNLKASANFQEYGGGGRVTIPTGTRFQPFANAGIGRMRLGGGASFSGYGSSVSFKASDSVMDFNVGGGFKVMFNPHFGMVVDVRGVKGNDVGWFGRAQAGIVYRIN